MSEPGLVPVERIASAILLLRGHKVLLDATLARLYGVPTKVLNQAVRRNIERFPGDFMFQLTAAEARRSRSQTVTLKKGRGQNIRYLPYAFTEQGVAMLASVLRHALELRYDSQFKVVFQAIRELMVPPTKEQKRIGFNQGGASGGEEGEGPGVRESDQLTRKRSRR